MAEGFLYLTVKPSMLLCCFFKKGFLAECEKFQFAAKFYELRMDIINQTVDIFMTTFYQRSEENRVCKSYFFSHLTVVIVY